MIYVALIVITLVLCYFYQHSGGCRNSEDRTNRNAVFVKRKSNRLTVKQVRRGLFFFITLLPCVLVAGLRYGISIDYLRVYVPSFSYIKNNTFTTLGVNEIGYKVLVKICSLIVSEPWFTFLCVSAITIALLFCAQKQNSRNFTLSILLLFGTGVYFDTFNGVRQYLAVAVFAFAYKYIKEKNFKKYLIAIIIAGTFHTSAYLLLPLYWLSKLKIKTRYWIIIFVSIFALRNQIVEVFVFVLGLFKKYNEYIVRNTLSNYTNLSVSDLLTSVIILIPCLMYEREMEKTEEGKFLFNMVMLGFAIALLSGILPLAYRILYYFKVTYLLCIPYVLSIIKPKSTRLLIKVGVCGLLVGMNVIGIVTLNWFAVLPYESIFH